MQIEPDNTNIDVPMSNKILDCIHGDDKINLKTTTYWCPPSINRVKMGQAQMKEKDLKPFSNDVSYIEAGRTSSFSYIRKDLYKFPYISMNLNHGNKTNKYLIYNNEEPSLVSRKNIFCMYPKDGNTGPNYSVCNKTLGISCRDPSCGLNSCKWAMLPYNISSPCINFNTFINTQQTTKPWTPPDYDWNELIIKTWNYDPSGPTKNGIIDGSGSWQPAALNSKTFGWSDAVSYTHLTLPTKRIV